MDDVYTLRAEREPTGRLTIAYPSKDLAVAAAEVISHLWETITITGPDGTLVLTLPPKVPSIFR